MNSKIDIKKALDQSVLSSPPQLLIRIIKSLNSDLTSRQIGEIIGQDQSVTAQVLRLANSSFFGFKGKVGTLDKAINILGIKMVRNIVMSSSLVSHTRQLKLWNINISNFWVHTILVAEFTKELSHLIKINPDEAYVAGLLHDIGKLIIYSQKLDKTRIFAEDHCDKDISAYEKSICGFTGNEVSKQLLSKWNIPDNITKAISHFQNFDVNDRLANAIFVANEFSNLITDKKYKSSITVETHQTLLSQLNLDHVNFNNYASRLPAIARKSEEMLEAISKNTPGNKRSRPAKGVSLVCPDVNPLSKSVLELLGYDVDLLNPIEVAKREKANQIDLEDDNDGPETPKVSMGEETRIMSFFSMFNSRLKELYSRPLNSDSDDNDNDDEDIELEPIRWQFLVIFDHSEPIDLPIGRKSYTVNCDASEGGSILPFFFTAVDLKDSV